MGGKNWLRFVICIRPLRNSLSLFALFVAPVFAVHKTGHGPHFRDQKAKIKGRINNLQKTPYRKFYCHLSEPLMPLIYPGGSERTQIGFVWERDWSDLPKPTTARDGPSGCLFRAAVDGQKEELKTSSFYRPVLEALGEGARCS